MLVMVAGVLHRRCASGLAHGYRPAMANDDAYAIGLMLGCGCGRKHNWAGQRKGKRSASGGLSRRATTVAPGRTTASKVVNSGLYAVVSLTKAPLLPSWSLVHSGKSV